MGLKKNICNGRLKKLGKGFDDLSMRVMTRYECLKCGYRVSSTIHDLKNCGKYNWKQSGVQ